MLDNETNNDINSYDASDKAGSEAHTTLDQVDDSLSSISGTSSESNEGTPCYTIPERPDVETMTLKYAIVQSIFKALDLNRDSGESLTNFKALLSLAREMYCLGKGVNVDDPAINKLWPQTWESAKKYLVELGYVDANEYFICLNKSHPRHWDIMDSQDELCRHCHNPGSIKYYYLGLEGKVKMWYSNPDMCQKMFAHWDHKDRWLNDRVNNHSDQVKKELWDGDRFSELSWFWNPNENWMLPVRCRTPGCSNVLSASYIEEQPNVDGLKELYCDKCCSSFFHKPEFTKGDPRNIAYIGTTIN